MLGRSGLLGSAEALGTAVHVLASAIVIGALLLAARALWEERAEAA